MIILPDEDGRGGTTCSATDTKSRPMKVAIIDDYLANALIVKTYIHKIGSIESVVFTDPVKALEWCATNTPDMILVDYIMPEIDGLEFIRRVRQMPQHDEVPVVMITALDRKDVLYEALDLGANDFLSKPVDELELSARTRNMLKLRARSVALANANRHLHRLATIDVLTDIYNRRSFLERAEQEVQRARRYAKPLSAMMLDADHFKKINDTYGHPGGDAVLKALSETCRSVIRDIDFPGRLGGEEFGICLPETTLEGALIVAERLRERVEAVPVPFEGRRIAFTVSIGVAALGDGEAEFSQLIARADRALYEAKQNGRNRVMADG